MAKDGLTTRPWYPWNPGAYMTDAAVLSMSRRQRLEYREALDLSWLSETPGLATPDQWRKWLGYSVEAWGTCQAGVCNDFAPAFKPQPDGKWLQKHMHSLYLRATEKSRTASENVQKRWNGRNTPVLPTDTKPIREKRVESKEKRIESKATSTPLARSDKTAIAPSRLSLPATNGQWWTPTDTDLAAWYAAYPGVNHDLAIQRMKAWLLANPTRGKTLRGLPRFASAWLSREQDSGKPQASTTLTGEAAIAAFLAEGKD